MHYWGSKKYKWKELFTKSDVIPEWWHHIISYQPVKFGVHSTFGIGFITIFICHETTCDQRIM